MNALKSFVDVSPDSDFSIHNLPYGVFSVAGNSPRVGVAIGDYILDLSVLEESNLLPPSQHSLFNQASLNAFIATGRPHWQKVRQRIQTLLSSDHSEMRDNQPLRDRALVKQKNARMYLPIEITGYTDFYSSREHAF